jgi:sugar/nucleoside kinase (ribokinase family)
MSVVVLGDVMVDVVARVSAPLAPASDTTAQIAFVGGGSGANTAAWLVEAGAAASLIGRVGDDAAGRAQVAELQDAGVDVRTAVDPERATGTCVVIVEPGGERTMLPDRGANLALAPADVPDDAFASARHLHVSGYALLDAGPRQAALAALARARSSGIATSVDPSSAAPLQALGADAFLRLVAGVDLLLPNADEAAVLTGERDPVLAAEAIARATGAEVVVTCGAAGAIHSDGGEAQHAPAAPQPVVDTTGAGDAFTAGLIVARLGGLAPSAALAAANALAARALALPGARPPRAGASAAMR